MMMTISILDIYLSLKFLSYTQLHIISPLSRASFKLKIALLIYINDMIAKNEFHRHHQLRINGNILVDRLPTTPKEHKVEKNQ